MIPQNTPEYRLAMAKRQAVNSAIEGELYRAYEKHGRTPWGKHQFYAILLEEVDELWEAIKHDCPFCDIEGEAIQVAAMVIRFLETSPCFKGPHITTGADPSLLAQPSPGATLEHNQRQRSNIAPLSPAAAEQLAELERNQARQRSAREWDDLEANDVEFQKALKAEQERQARPFHNYTCNSCGKRFDIRQGDAIACPNVCYATSTLNY